MKIVILLVLFVNLIYADAKQDIFNLYQNAKHEEACSIGSANFSQYRDDEEFISIYAFSCLYSDHIDRLAIPIVTLKNSKEARANSAYFATILMQKKLLFYALNDNYNLAKRTVQTTTDYILSKVFNLYSNIAKHKLQKYYILKDKKNSDLTYRLYLQKIDNKMSIVIEELNNSVIIKKHIYK